jgi:hypothetical protein
VALWEGVSRKISVEGVEEMLWKRVQAARSMEAEILKKSIQYCIRYIYIYIYILIPYTILYMLLIITGSLQIGQGVSLPTSYDSLL